MRRFGLIGRKLGHSFSAKYFAEKFEREGLSAECEYSLYELSEIGQVEGFVGSTPSLVGFNVTIPYKQQVFKFLDEVDPAAEAIGAVNVVKVKREQGRIALKGYNTDVIGFSESIRPLLQPHHTHALVLGTGGASKAVHYALQQLGVTTMAVSRTRGEHILAYEDLTPEVLLQYKVIVNTTPLGMHPKEDECPALDYSVINEQYLLFDVIYNPEKTLFLQRGEQAGATICNGMDMLIGQAKAAWRIWNASEPAEAL